MKKKKPDPDAAWRTEYKLENGECELAKWLGVTFDDFKLTNHGKPVCIPAHELNHIWSLGVRLNVPANVIHIDKQAHDWFHAHPLEGRVACLLAKVRKLESAQLIYLRSGLPEDHSDFLLADIDRAAAKSALGWVRCLDFNVPLYDQWHSELVAKLQDLRFRQHIGGPE